MLSIENLHRIRIASPTDVAPAATSFRDIVESSTNLRVAPWHDIATASPMVDNEHNLLVTNIFGWTDKETDGWWCSSMLGLTSPLATACRYESEPFWCNAEGFRAKRYNPFLANIDISEFEIKAQSQASIVVPVHLPFGQVGSVGFSRENCNDLTVEFEKFSDMLGLYSRTFIAGYVSVMCAQQHLPTQPQVSGRELECLKWAALGKTDSEIALIMSLSHSTVRFHMNNLAQKFNSVNRTQTLLKALQLGYVKLRTEIR